MRWTVAGAYLLFLSVVAAQNPNPYEIEISGTLTGNDHHTYIEHNFEVPDGIERLIVDFEQDGGEERTVIDIGLADPSGIRGWTRSNKTHLILAAADSTMGYRNGPILSAVYCSSISTRTGGLR